MSSPDPPRVPRGTKVARVFVGSDEHEFVIHTNLLNAASGFFKKALQGGFAEAETQEVKIPEMESEVFAFLEDWLYMSGSSLKPPSVIRALQKWYEDEYYLKVYRMAEFLMMPGLQLLALYRLEVIFDNKYPTMPSREFLHSLFSEEAPRAMQMYIVEHTAFWLLHSPKTKKSEWAQLFTTHDRFGTEMALAMIRSQGQGSEYPHPRDVSGFFEKHGFGLARLEKQARESDQKNLPSANFKELGRASTTRSDDHNPSPLLWPAPFSFGNPPPPAFGRTPSPAFGNAQAPTQLSFGTLSRPSSTNN